MGLRRNLFQTSSTAMTTLRSEARGSSRSRMTFWDRVQASLYDTWGLTTAGTRSTVSAPQSFALRSDVSIPATLLLTTSGSALESGKFQWSMFITEWTRSPDWADALRTSSAWAGSAMVCI